MRKAVVVRLVFGLAWLVCWGLDALIMWGLFTHRLPAGRDANTGLPDSGLFGWIGSFLFCFGLVFLIGMVSYKEEKKP